MIALEHLGDGSASERNFQKLAQLTLDTGGITRRLLGPFSASSGALAAGGAVNVTVNHNLAIPGGAYFVLGEPLDAGFGYSINWIASTKTANSVIIAFKNNGGIAGAALTINFFVLA